MLARKSQLQISKPTGMSAMERSRLNQAKTIAQRRNDWNEVAEIDAKLADEAARSSEQQQSARPDTVQDMLAKVNERNRKANMEAVRKAEIAEAERKKRERKSLAQNGGRSTPVDPSARLKTVPRLFNSNTPVTRLVTVCCWVNYSDIYQTWDACDCFPRCADSVSACEEEQLV